MAVKIEIRILHHYIDVSTIELIMAITHKKVRVGTLLHP